VKKPYGFRRSPGYLQVVKIARQHGLIFNNIQDAAILTDAAPNIVDWNPAAVRIFGFSRQEVLGQSPAILYRSQDRPFLPHHIWSVLIQDGRYEGEVTLIDCQGVDKVGEIVIVSLHNLGGEVVGSLGVFHDITGRVLAEQALARARNILRTLIDSLPDAVFAKDIEARKILSNPTDVAYMGLSSEADGLGRTDAEIYPAEVAADFYADDMRVLIIRHPPFAGSRRADAGWSGKMALDPVF
jgi:PAS domain S-box-containing protein